MRRSILAFLAPLACLAASAFAHFPFILAGAGGATARLIMSETLTPDPEVSIDTLAGITLSIRGRDGRETPLTLTKGEQWMTMALPGDGARVIHGVADLGVNQRGTSPAHVLVYYPKTLVGDPFDPAMTLGASVPVELVPIRADGAFKLQFLVAGKPAGAGQEIRLIHPDNGDEKYTTDDRGQIGPFSEPGRYGAWARNWVDESGKRADKAYEQVRQYATVVFDFGDAPQAEAPADGAASAPIRPFATLPYHAASFGAVAVDGWLYMFGGHTAERHEYSTASVSRRFQRLNLRNPSEWEELPSGDVAVQGMNLATHKGRIIRIGGMEPRNPPGEKGDSYSLTSNAIFDPAAGKWKALPELPRPRSSHDVVVVGDTLYVIGGWWMKGRDTEPQFFDTMEVMDLSAAQPAWTSVPQPFSRRALIVAALDTKIFVIGGFDSEDVPHLEVDVYDVKAKAWSKGPSIPGKERDGFAPAACTLDGAIFVSVGSGSLFKLNADQKGWTRVARTTPRLAHRMIPFGDEVIIVGGASEAKMVDLIEAVKVK